MTKYLIKCEPNFYAGDIHGNDESHYVKTLNGCTVILNSRADATALVKMLSDLGHGPYVLAHNQYAAPDYEVVRYRGKIPAGTLESAMVGLQLHYDFRPNGNRIR